MKIFIHPSFLSQNLIASTTSFVLPTILSSSRSVSSLPNIQKLYLSSLSNRRFSRVCVPLINNTLNTLSNSSLSTKRIIVPTCSFSSATSVLFTAKNTNTNVPSTTASTSSSSNDIIITTKDGKQITLPSKSFAGLSEEYKQLLIERVERGRTLPILYKNPGAYSQLDRVPDSVIAALPPPNPPMWPMEESAITLRILKGFLIVIALLGLAIYLHLKLTLKGTTRLELERNLPSLSNLLTKLGILDDFTRIETLLDRNNLYLRIFTKYADITHTSSTKAKGMNSPSTMISLQRTIILLSALLGDDNNLLMNSNHTNSNKHKEIQEQINQQLQQLQYNKKINLTSQEFLTLFLLTTKSLNNTVIYLACDELFGIVGASSRAVEELGILYDRVIQGRKLHEQFSVLALTELAMELGFTIDEITTSQFLLDCKAVANNSIPTPEELLILRDNHFKSNKITVSKTSNSSSSTAPSLAAIPSLFRTWTVPVQKDEFINFMSTCINGITIEDERLSEYLRVFYMLHMSGIREQAGVRSV